MIPTPGHWIFGLIPAILLLVALRVASRRRGSLRSVLSRWNLLFILGAASLLSFYSLASYQNQFQQRTRQIEQEFLEQAKGQIRQRAEFLQRWIQDEKTSAEEQLKVRLKQVVDQAILNAQHLVDLYHDQLDQSALTRLVIEALRPMRFSHGRGYLFATRRDGTELLFADHPEFEGHDMLDMKDQDGIYYVREMIRLCQTAGEGYCTYRISQPGSTRWDHRKIAYVRYFAPLDCLIGTGEYPESFESQLQQEIIEKLDHLALDAPLSLFGADYNGISLFGPVKGQNVLNIQDHDGLFVVKELIRAAQRGGDFVSYRMPGALGQGNYRKISYCLSIAGWNWYVGAGINLEYVERNAARSALELQEVLRRQLWQNGLLILALVLLLWLISRHLSLAIRSNVDQLNSALTQAVNCNQAIKLEAPAFDEFAEIAQAANQMLSQCRTAETHLRETQQRFRIALENAPLLVVLFNHQGQILISNSMWQTTLQELAGPLPRNFPLDLLDENSQRQFKAAVESIVHDHTSQCRFDMTFCAEGMPLRDFDVSLAPITLPQTPGPTLLFMAKEITQRLQAEKRLQWLAHYDALTGLANRYNASEQLENILGQPGRGTRWLFMIDINRFKRINELYGHKRGDQLLETIARRMQTVSPLPLLTARLSGNEFILVIEFTNDQTPGDFAPQLYEHLFQTICLEGTCLSVEARIGAVRCENDSVSKLLHKVDLALRTVKKNNPTDKFLLYDEILDQQYQEEERLEKALGEALHSPEQFELHFQPIWNLTERKLKGFEALVRWQHPDMGSIAPSCFIPLAERRALIVPLGRIIFERACQTLAHWLEQYPAVGSMGLRLSVNMAPQQFVTEDFIDELSASLSRWRIPPSTLCIEITETSLMEDPQLAIERIQKLKRLGITISIDDFGTGYSSLAYLQQFDVDTIKLDRSMIRNITEQRSAEKISDAVIRLAHDLDLETVAEGVEELEQLQLLKQLNCDAIQGYLSGKPCSRHDAEEWLRNPAFPFSRID
ncbi:MAG: cache domain-containing protein [Desulfuromonadaceae bacterium]|nr:cache domain-containing protein [Desulfuromonadaceae bacterium]